MHLSSPTTPSLNQLIILHERVEQGWCFTLADKPSSTCFVGQNYNKFKQSKLFWSVFLQLQVPSIPLFLVCVFKYFVLSYQVWELFTQACQMCNNQNCHPLISQGRLIARVSWRG